MNLKDHLLVFISVFIAWLIFYLIGIPFNYFLEWTAPDKIIVILIGVFGIFPVFCFVLCALLKGDYFKTSLWVSVYASVEIFLLDYIMIGLIAGQGIGFFQTYWLQSISYLTPWMVMPFIGIAMKRFKEYI